MPSTHLRAQHTSPVHHFMLQAMHSALMSLTPEDHDATTLASSSFSERPSVRSRLEAAAQLSHHPFKQHISFSSIDHELQQSTEVRGSTQGQPQWQGLHPVTRAARMGFDAEPTCGSPECAGCGWRMLSHVIERARSMAGMSQVHCRSC